MYVDEDVEKILREVTKKEQISEKILEKVLINKHSFAKELNEGDAKFDNIYSKIFRIAGNYRLASSDQLD